MSLTHNEFHEQQMIARLIEQFKNKPIIRASIVAFAAQTQDLEDANWDLYNGFTLETAVGDQLDILGEIAGQPRLGFADDDYRDWISARILINRSRGTGDEILKVANLVAVDSTSNPTIELVEFYPAGYVVRLFNYQGNARTIFDILRAAKPAGVGFVLEFSPQALDDIFTFSSSDAIEADTDKGFSDVARTTGGHFAGAYR